MADGSTYSNLLLDSLSEDVLRRLRPALHHVGLEQGAILKHSSKPIEHVYFPASGIYSALIKHPRNQRVETGLVGREGMLGYSLALSDLPDPSEVVVQVPGSTWRLKAGAFVQALEDREFQSHILRYVHAMIIQLAQTSVAQSKATLGIRLARWLLMCNDRVRDNQIPLTHDLVADMLGTRRAGVTVALHELEGEGLIRSKRCLVEVLDRAGLEQKAGDFYGDPEAQYQRLFPACLI